MPQSLTQIFIHAVFSVKDRAPIISSAIQPGLHRYLQGILKNHKCPALQVGGIEDHVHLLFVLHKTVAISEIIEEVKTGSSKWMKTQGLRDFYWQAGYGAFSVSKSQRDTVIQYIKTQAKHHRKMDC